ncbi:hypothetical protein OK016_11980 [Vibrio chagasii]|nr:hypothetical protein [Vibrio chagasii]
METGLDVIKGAILGAEKVLAWYRTNGGNGL